MKSEHRSQSLNFIRFNHKLKKYIFQKEDYWQIFQLGKKDSKIKTKRLSFNAFNDRKGTENENNLEKKIEQRFNKIDKDIGEIKEDIKDIKGEMKEIKFLNLMTFYRTENISEVKKQEMKQILEKNFNTVFENFKKAFELDSDKNNKNLSENENNLNTHNDNGHPKINTSESDIKISSKNNTANKKTKSQERNPKKKFSFTPKQKKINIVQKKGNVQMKQNPFKKEVDKPRINALQKIIKNKNIKNKYGPDEKKNITTNEKVIKKSSNIARPKGNSKTFYYHYSLKQMESSKNSEKSMRSNPFSGKYSKDSDS